MRTSSARQQGFENKPRLGFKLLPGHGNPHFRSLGVIFLLWRQDNAQFVALRVTQTTPNTVCFNPKALQVVPIQGHRARFGGASVTGGADSGTPGEIWRGKRDRWCRFRDTGRGLDEVWTRCGRGVGEVWLRCGSQRSESSLCSPRTRFLPWLFPKSWPEASLVRQTHHQDATLPDDTSFSTRSIGDGEYCVHPGIDSG